MKLSELIKKLQALDKSIPFDSEVVSGDDWQPLVISAVYHDPPYTFIQFQECGEMTGGWDESEE